MIVFSFIVLPSICTLMNWIFMFYLPFFPIILVIFDFLYFLYIFVIDAIFQQICIVSIWKLLFAGDLGPLKAHQIL